MKISDKDKGLVTEGSILEHYFETGERVYDTKAIENGEIDVEAAEEEYDRQIMLALEEKERKDDLLEERRKMQQLEQEEIEKRVEKAKTLFHQGFNCSQAVFAACADIYGIEDETLALRLAASFGGGIGRMRQTCGAACGMFMLAGLENGSAIEGDAEGKKQNYALVQSLAEKFKQENGSLICSELLGIAPKPQEPTPEARTEAYYQKRPCVEMVATAVRIFLSTIDHN